MKVCFPARKNGGKDYISVDEIMTQVLGEPHGCWLAGSNLLWHGGLHISTVTAPDSVLTAETVDSAVPLQFMTGGEVVAWRLNKDYLTCRYNGQTLQYSSTFVLVKSVCQPDPENDKTWLEFYTLYMGLAPLSAFPKTACWSVTEKGDRLRKRQYSGAEKEGQKAPVPGGGTLKKGTRVAVIKQTTFELDGKSQPFGLAKVLNDKGEMTGKSFWISLVPDYMKKESSQYAHLPAWMQQAVKQGSFGEVVKPAAKLEVAAGDAVGFLSKDVDPIGMGKVESSHFAHIEVLSNDVRMPAFLENPGKITTGRQYIRIHSGKSIYQKNGTGAASTFKAMSCVVVKDSGKILSADKCNPLKDAQGKTWYEISQGNWMSESDVDVLHQYDLKELGFAALKEESTADMSKSLREGWMKSMLNRFSEMVNRDRGIQQQQVSDYYKKAVNNIDKDGDGELSAEELFYAVHHPEMDIRNIAARMVVKHDSEWFGDSSHHKWEVYFKNYDLLRIKYAKQWRDDVEWMSQVEAFKSEEPIWHMHPVMFCSAIKSASECEITVELIEKLLGHKNQWFTGKRGGKVFAAHFKNTYPDVYEFDKQIFVNLLNEQLNIYGIAGAYHKAHFLSQCLHESAHLDTTIEFGSGRNYDPGRHKDAVKNGNTVVGDGPRYKGRGLIQLTWKKNYQHFSEYSGVDCVNNSELIASVMGNAIKASCWFWRNNGGVHKMYDSKGDINILIDHKKNDVELITLAVNGGQNGLSERQKYFDSIKKEWGLE